MSENEFFEAQNFEEVRMQMLPGNKPQLKKEDAVRLLDTWDIKKYPVKLLGIRGYFKKTMGDPNKNDINIYDDAIFIVSANHYSSWNANTDPSRMIKDVAVLKPGGPYIYKVGLHGISGPNPYEALRQYGNVTVIRNGTVEVTDSPRNRFYIDIHRGGYNITSSLGCQTIHPDQWFDFLKTVKAQLKANNQDYIPYCLVEY
jgi:lysozyme